jgi:TadE-like protein
MNHKGRIRRRERGAALVEMAIVLPLLVLLLFGMIEASWAFALTNDVRHGTREGARLAAVDFGDVATIGQEVCDRMDATNATVVVSLGDGSGGVDPGGRGSEGRITVALSYTSLTGVLDQFFGSKSLTSDIDFIVEQPLTGAAQWWTSGATTSFTCNP